MQEILKRTPDDHTDFVNLKLATEQMVKAGAAVNEKKREQEEREKKDRQDELGKKIYRWQNRGGVRNFKVWVQIVLIS